MVVAVLVWAVPSHEPWFRDAWTVAEPEPLDGAVYVEPETVPEPDWSDHVGEPPVAVDGVLETLRVVLPLLHKEVLPADAVIDVRHGGGAV